MNVSVPRFRGVMSPVLTPFNADLTPSPTRFVKHCRWLLDQEVGLAIFGTNSEANSLSVKEKLTLLDALLAAGLLSASGEAASTGGRPPARLAFNPDAGVVLGADLGATHALVALTDLRGRVVAEKGFGIDISTGPGPVLDSVVRTGRRLLKDAGRGRADLAGVGVGLPGPVEH
jgi:hypothetical protein